MRLVLVVLVALLLAATLWFVLKSCQAATAPQTIPSPTAASTSPSQVTSGQASSGQSTAQTAAQPKPAPVSVAAPSTPPLTADPAPLVSPDLPSVTASSPIANPRDTGTTLAGGTATGSKFATWTPRGRSKPIDDSIAGIADPPADLQWFSPASGRSIGMSDMAQPGPRVPTLNPDSPVSLTIATRSFTRLSVQGAPQAEVGFVTHSGGIFLPSQRGEATVVSNDQGFATVVYHATSEVTGPVRIKAFSAACANEVQFSLIVTEPAGTSP